LQVLTEVPAMPIYAYKCASCGHAKDVLQKISDAPLSDCPACGKPTFSKQLTAAGFQLKGSGWYATDFRGGSGATSAPAAASDASSGDTTASASTTEAAPAASAAGGCGASCACH
jgi:putative FmdB family regulatory protein